MLVLSCSSRRLKLCPQAISKVLQIPQARAARAPPFLAGGLGHLERFDPHRFGRPVAAVGGDLLDRCDHVHAVAHRAEDGVLTVQPGGRRGGDDEELGAVGIGAGVGHGQRPPLDAVLVDLVLERVARTAGAGALGAAALDHEVGDDAVEGEPVVEALARQLAEVAHRARGVLIEQLDLDSAVVGGQRGLGHVAAYSVARRRSWRPRSAPPIAPRMMPMIVVATGSTKWWSGSIALARTPVAEWTTRMKIPNSRPPEKPRRDPSSAVGCSWPAARPPRIPTRVATV